MYVLHLGCAGLPGRTALRSPRHSGFLSYIYSCHLYLPGSHNARDLSRPVAIGRRVKSRVVDKGSLLIAISDGVQRNSAFLFPLCRTKNQLPPRAPVQPLRFLNASVVLLARSQPDMGGWATTTMLGYVPRLYPSCAQNGTRLRSTRWILSCPCWFPLPVVSSTRWPC